MQIYSYLVEFSLEGEWRWRVFGSGGKQVRSATAKNQGEANSAALKAIDELKLQGGDEVRGYFEITDGATRAL